MRKLMALVAVLGLAATPAFAGLTPDSFGRVQANLNQPSGHTVGVYGQTVSGAPGLYSNISFYPTGTATYSVSFAFHWPFSGSTYITDYYTGFVLGWDNSEIQIVNMTSPTNMGSAQYGGWVNGWNNFPASSSWASISLTGNLQWGNFYAAPMNSTTFLWSSGVYPFVKIDFKVRPGAVDDPGHLDLFMVSAWNLFAISGSLPPTAGHYWYSGSVINSESYGINVLPEPASLSLLAIGFATTGFGVWRRRR